MVSNHKSHSIETMMEEIPGVGKIPCVQRMMQVEWTTPTKSDAYLFLGPYKISCNTYQYIQSITSIPVHRDVATLSSARQVQREVNRAFGSSVKRFTNSVVRLHHVDGSSVTCYCDELHHVVCRSVLAVNCPEKVPDDNPTTTIHLL